MSVRFLIACVLTTACTQALASPPDGSAAKCCDQPARPKSIVKVYPVADLVVPLENARAANSAKVDMPMSQPLPMSPVPLILPVSLPPSQTPASGQHIRFEFGCPAADYQDVPRQAEYQWEPAWFTQEPSNPKPSSPCSAPCCTSSRAAVPTCETQLMELITHTIQPQSWARQGGSGVMDYYGLGMALVVNQTPEVQEQIADLLAALRRLQDAEVAVEVRLITLSEPIVQQMGLDFAGCRQEAKNPKQASATGSCPCTSTSKGQRMAFLNDTQVFQLMEAVQADPLASTLQLPKLTVLNGQNSTISQMEQQYFVTGVKTIKHGGQVIYCPENTPYSTGLQVKVQPTISADRRFVQMKLKVQQTNLDPSPIPLFPVTTFISPKFEGGAVGEPIPFTQYLQQPKFSTVEVEKAVCIPDGGTVLLGGWKQTRQERQEVGVPVLSKIPYVERLFNKQVNTRSENEQVLLLVTPRVILNEEQEICPVPRSPVQVQKTAKDLTPKPCCQAKEKDAVRIVIFTPPARESVAAVVKQYEEACAAGRLEAARKLAAEALALDPTCFSKKGQGR